MSEKDFSSIIIQFDDEHEPEETIQEVLRLVKEGFTSGYHPTWEMKKKED